MKHFTTLVVLLLMSAFAFANEIDNLQTNEEVQQFLCKQVNKDLDDVFLIDNKIPDTSFFGKGKFFKVDLDQNGLIDGWKISIFFIVFSGNKDGAFVFDKLIQRSGIHHSSHWFQNLSLQFLAYLENGYTQ